MGILDELVEKKDILTYIEVRKAQMELARNNELKKAKPREYNTINRIFEGRMRELRTLEHIAKNGAFKNYSKRHWNSIEKRDNMEAFVINTSAMDNMDLSEKALKNFDSLLGLDNEERVVKYFDND